MRIAVRLDELRSLAARAGIRAPDVSKWSVGMHVEHCCLAMIGVGKVLASSTPPAPPSEFSLPRILVLIAGLIPRGQVQAPEAVTPTSEPDGERLRSLLDEAETVMTRSQRLGPGVWFEHFSLGVMDRDQSLRFLRSHNAHHVRIIRDILRAGSSDAG